MLSDRCPVCLSVLSVMLVYCGQMVGWIKIKLGMQVGLSPGHIVLDGDPAPTPPKGQRPPIFGPYILWPNGWMDQHATWYGGRPWPKQHCVRWGTSCPPQKGAEPPIFGPCILWPNGCMDQDATWYGGRLWPWPAPCPQNRRQSPPSQFLAHVYCGQTAGWIKLPLNTEVGLCPGDVVLDGDPSPH